MQFNTSNCALIYSWKRYINHIERGEIDSLQGMFWIFAAALKALGAFMQTLHNKLFWLELTYNKLFWMELTFTSIVQQEMNSLWYHLNLEAEQ